MQLDILSTPETRLTAYGEAIQERLEEMANFYSDIKVEKYVLMPNHVHLLIHIPGILEEKTDNHDCRTSRLSNFLGTFKRLTNRTLGDKIWQSRSYDHVIRGKQDFLKIWEYIENNPARWAEDRFYIE